MVYIHLRDPFCVHYDLSSMHCAIIWGTIRKTREEEEGLPLDRTNLKFKVFEACRATRFNIIQINYNCGNAISAAVLSRINQICIVRKE